MARTWPLVVLGMLCALAVARFVLTAFSYGHPAWFDEELNPLFNYVRQGQPVTSIDQRQYGVVVFLVFEPAVRLLGTNPDLLASYALAVALPCVLGAFALIARRYARGDLTRLLLLATLWFSAVPLLYVVAQRMVDAWQLFFLSLALFLFTGSPKLRRLAGLPLAAAALTKLLPALLLVYLLVRCWRAGLIGLAGLAALLGVGQLMYGPLIGFGYPLSVLATGPEAVRRWSTHFENNSVRGLVYKLAAGFRLQGDSTAYVLPPEWLPVLNALAYLLAAGLVACLLLVAWRSRGREGLVPRSIEFALAIVTMLLVSPHTAQDYTVAMLPVFGVGLYLAMRGEPERWSRGMLVLGGAAALLVGVFLPMNIMGRVLLLGPLLDLTHNAHNPLFTAGDTGSPGIGVYDFFGFPGLGLLLAWLLLLRLERLFSPFGLRRPAHAGPTGRARFRLKRSELLAGWRVLTVVAIGLGLLALRACERYTSEYQTLPALDWLESRPPLAESADVPSAIDLARGAARVLPLLEIRDDARPYLPGLGPPSLSRRTIGGVRDAAVIQVGTPEVPRPRLQVTLHVTVFNRTVRAAAWTSLLDHEFDLRDPGTGTAQLRLTGADSEDLRPSQAGREAQNTDRVWITHPGESPGGEATVVGARGPVVFELQALAQRPGASGEISQAEALDLSARAEHIAREAASDWTAWLLPLLSPSRA